jgi:hypothetical protein
MSSVQSFIKQQNIIYGAIAPSVNLYTFTQTAATVPAVGTFTAGLVTVDSSSNITPIFRDMGEVIVSANRTFRRVQMLTNLSTTYGVGGSPAVAPAVDGYRTYFAEVSMINGQGVMSNLYQMRG